MRALFFRKALFSFIFVKRVVCLDIKIADKVVTLDIRTKSLIQGNPIRFKKGLTVKGNPFFILIFMLMLDMARDALNFAKYIVKTTTSLFRGLCRRSVLKEWERLAKAQSAAIFILSKDRGRTMRTKRFVCFFIKHRKTVDRIK